MRVCLRRGVGGSSTRWAKASVMARQPLWASAFGAYSGDWGSTRHGLKYPVRPELRHGHDAVTAPPRLLCDGILIAPQDKVSRRRSHPFSAATRRARCSSAAAFSPKSVYASSCRLRPHASGRRRRPSIVRENRLYVLNATLRRRRLREGRSRRFCAWSRDATDLLVEIRHAYLKGLQVAETCEST